jgi:UDP:flavonoid glycosyltransferase YjiC (YdhE family)
MTTEDRWNAIQNQWISDGKFRERFESNPKAVLAEMGIEVEEDIQIHVHAPSSLREVHLVMPAAIDDANLEPLRAQAADVVIMCRSSVPGGTCWDTPNCPTRATCSCHNTAC